MSYKELATKKPFIVNKNLGSAVEVEPEELTSTNADGATLSAHVHQFTRHTATIYTDGWRGYNRIDRSRCDRLSW